MKNLSQKVFFSKRKNHENIVTGLLANEGLMGPYKKINESCHLKPRTMNKFMASR